MEPISFDITDPKTFCSTMKNCSLVDTRMELLYVVIEHNFAILHLNLTEARQQTF